MGSHRIIHRPLFVFFLNSIFHRALFHPWKSNVFRGQTDHQMDSEYSFGCQTRWEGGGHQSSEIWFGRVGRGSLRFQWKCRNASCAQPMQSSPSQVAQVFRVGNESTLLQEMLEIRLAIPFARMCKMVKKNDGTKWEWERKDLSLRETQKNFDEKYTILWLNPKRRIKF